MTAVPGFHSGVGGGGYLREESGAFLVTFECHAKCGRGALSIVGPPQIGPVHAVFEYTPADEAGKVRVTPFNALLQRRIANPALLRQQHSHKASQAGLVHLGITGEASVALWQGQLVSIEPTGVLPLGESQCHDFDVGQQGVVLGQKVPLAFRDQLVTPVPGAVGIILEEPVRSLLGRPLLLANRHRRGFGAVQSHPGQLGQVKPASPNQVFLCPFENGFSLRAVIGCGITVGAKHDELQHNLLVSFEDQRQLTARLFGLSTIDGPCQLAPHIRSELRPTRTDNEITHFDLTVGRGPLGNLGYLDSRL